MLIRQIRLSQAEKDKLIRLKAKTGISGWNVLCRWALCASLADPTSPYGPEIPSNSNVEMTWQTFGGDYQEIYEALIIQRCKDDVFDSSPVEMVKYFRLLLNRGINQLSAKTGPKDIFELLALVNN